MDAKQNGEQGAFATQETAEYSPQKGLTKREYFAALALQGILVGVDKPHHDACAILAVCSADALLAELAKEVKP